MRIVLDPHGKYVELKANEWVRFYFDDETALPGEVNRFVDAHPDPDTGRLVLRSDGWHGGIIVRPRAANEIEIESEKGK
jgi:hypothetical protein